MRKYALIILFFLSLAVVTGVEPIYHYADLTLEQSIDNDVVIVPTQSNYNIQYFDINLFLFPMNSYRQTILSSELNPEPEGQLFHWAYPQERTLQLRTAFTLKTSNEPVKITEKVPFPLKSLPLSITEYVQQTESIDTNADIRSLAQSLAQDTDDLFELEFKISQWINKHISYNLSTVTAEANYPASWVLDNGYGVCDEITNLFIAINRALGVPARFVSGIAYSDSILFTEKWGNHGWAEVYFPEYGWVPYDVTYQEYGEIDATHISLEKAIDGTSPSVEYRTKGLYYNFEPTALDFTTDIISYGALRTPKTELDLSVKESSVDFGSYNLFELDVENLRDYYVVETVAIARAAELEYVNTIQQSVMLAPHETKKLFWLIHVDPDLDKNYIYTFPIGAYSLSGSEDETAFSVLSRSKKYSESYMSQFMEEQDEKIISLSLDCEHEQNYLLGSEVMLHCESPTILESICLVDNCVTNTKTADFTIPAETIGINTAIVTAQNSEGTKKNFFTYQVIDQAKIVIGNISITQNVPFESFATLKLDLKKNSSANPKNVTMKLTHEMLEKEWFFSYLEKDKSFEIELPAQGYVLGTNEFTVIVEYEDSQGVSHTINATTSSSLAPLTAAQKMIITYNTYAAKVISFMMRFGIERYYAEIIAPATIMIILFVLVTIIKNGIYLSLQGRIVEVKQVTAKEKKKGKKK